MFKYYIKKVNSLKSIIYICNFQINKIINRIIIINFFFLTFNIIMIYIIKNNSIFIATNLI